MSAFSDTDSMDTTEDMDAYFSQHRVVALEHNPVNEMVSLNAKLRNYSAHIGCKAKNAHGDLSESAEALRAVSPNV